MSVVTPADAVTKDLGPAYDGGGERWYGVTVSTAPGWPRQIRRGYRIRAYSDSLAARKGLDLFSKEVDGPSRLIVEG